MKLFSDRFDSRARQESILGGGINLGSLFTGQDVSVFAGAEYFSPIPNLSLKIEYDPTDYSYSFQQSYDRYH